MTQRFNLNFFKRVVQDGRWTVHIEADLKVTVQHYSGLQFPKDELPAHLHGRKLSVAIHRLINHDSTHLSKVLILAERLLCRYGDGWVDWKVWCEDSREYITIRNAGRAGLGWVRSRLDPLEVPRRRVA